MSDVTEIYICKAGQELRQGKLEHSGEIASKDQAEQDAARRCKADATIARIAYYAVDRSGAFRNFFTYDNPKAAAVRGPRAAVGGTERAAGVGVRRPARPPTLFQRVRAVFEED